MRNGKKIIFLLVLLPLRLLSQDITGLWQGTLYNDTTRLYYKYEIGISEDKKGKLSGFSHTWFLLDDQQFYGVKKVKVRRAADGKLIIEDDGLIANNYPVSPAKHVRQLNVLALDVNDSVMTLSGPYSTNRTKEYRSLTGSVLVRRKKDFRQSALVPHLQELGLDEQLSFVKEENNMLAAAEKKKITEQLLAQEDAVAKIDLAKKENALAQAQALKSQKNTSEKQVVNNKPVEAIAKNENKKQAAIIQPVINENKILATGATALDRKDINPQTKKTKDSSFAVTKVFTSAEKNTVKIISDEPNDSKPKDIAKIENTSAPKTAQPIEKVITSVAIPQKELPASEYTSSGKLTSISPIPVARKIDLPAAEVANRKTILQQTVYFQTDSLQLALYDNGEVDGDTVSILMNSELIMARQGLSTNAVRKTIYIDPNADSIQLVMYAENLGAIAPNTGLLVVRDGKDLYEIRFTGDLQKNAAIVFRRKK
ncbi:MAG: hypothetical protein ABIY51_07645 [Ferruginibacter sp.]